MLTRAEASTTSRESVGRDDEWLPAVAARDFGGTLSDALVDNEHLMVANAGAWGTYGPSSIVVAAAASGDEIGGIVVESVPVDVVGLDGAASPAALDPLQRTSAPVAALRSDTDLLHEDQTVFLNGPVTGREWVVGPIQVPVLPHMDIVPASGRTD